MGKTLPLLHLAFFGTYEQGEYSQTLADSTEGVQLTLEPPPHE